MSLNSTDTKPITVTIPKCLTYVATAYSQDTNAGIIQALRAATHVFHTHNKLIYSPILHWHNLATMNGWALNHETWEAHDLYMLSLCKDIVIVCSIWPNWLQSKGLQHEADYAIKHNIPIWFLHPGVNALQTEPAKPFVSKLQ